MDEIQKHRKKSLKFKLGNRYLTKKTACFQAETPMGLQLNFRQKRAIKNLHLKVYLYAASIGAGAVLVVILPFYWTSVFTAQQFTFFGIHFEFELAYLAYALIMLFPEIWLLQIINVRAVKELCEIYQYPSANQKDYNEQVALLTEAGLEMPSNHMKLLEINPYIGLSKFSYYSLFLFNKLKATLTNVLMKLLVKRLLGRYALRIVTDLGGIPIYAFWNAWGSRQVLKEAKMRIVASTTTAEFLHRFSKEELLLVKEQLPLLIHFIAQQKRQYNFALYAFMKALLERIPDLNLQIKHEVKLRELLTEEEAQNNVLGRLLVFGMIVDGSLSVKERLTLRKYDEESWFPMTLSEIDIVLKKYVSGEGMKQF